MFLAYIGKYTYNENMKKDVTFWYLSHVWKVSASVQSRQSICSHKYSKDVNDIEFR